MLYLYMIMMLAWNLDKDTHAYFRIYLDGFINQRKISKGIREFVRDAQIHQQFTDGQIRKYSPSLKEIADRHRLQFNRLRINLPNRISRNRLPEMKFDGKRWIYNEGELSTQGSLDLVPFQGGCIKHMHPGEAWPQMLLPRHQRTSSLIDSIHPSKYYHSAKKLSAPSRPHTNP